ncbi:hypothetical protein HAX54_052829 [Datura stramonium]|uniref:Uncharacterized protein n=1 Tax=Datura stramonium TaxID=4076 RepID=A0ABS8SZI3_DATST|nr:hypothetical protein [Datura stramonium]
MRLLGMMYNRHIIHRLNLRGRIIASSLIGISHILTYDAECEVQPIFAMRGPCCGFLMLQLLKTELPEPLALDIRLMYELSYVAPCVEFMLHPSSCSKYSFKGSPVLPF